MTAPLEVSGAAAEAQPEAGLAGIEAKAVEGRSLGQIAWLRLRRDKVALAGGVVVVLLILVAIFAPLIVKLLGHPPNEFHQELIDPSLQIAEGHVRRHQQGVPVRPRAGRTAATSSAGSSTARGSRCWSRSSPRCWRWSSAPCSA